VRLFKLISLAKLIANLTTRSVRFVHLNESVLTRYSYAVGVFGIVVVYPSVSLPSVTDIP